MDEKEWDEIEKARAELQKRIMEKVKPDLERLDEARKNIDIEAGKFAYKGIKPSGKPPIVIRVNVETGEIDKENLWTR